MRISKVYQNMEDFEKFIFWVAISFSFYLLSLIVFNKFF